MKESNNKIILFLGYYNHKNLGDDLFQYIFTNIFNKSGYGIKFIDPNHLSQIDNNVEILICGGGEIFTDYFMAKIIKLKNEYETTFNKRLPTYAISIGITYPNQIVENKTHYVDIFDYIICRNKHDYNLLIPRIKNVIYLPDVVSLLPLILHSKKTTFGGSIKKYQSSSKTIGIFLARSVYNNGMNTNYMNIVKQFASVFDELARDDYELELVCMNYNIKNHDECDVYINKDVMDNMKYTSKVRTKIIDINEIDKINDTFSKYKFTICMRFHAHILSHMFNVPFISLSCTPKTKYFMIDNKLECNMLEMIFGERFVMGFTDHKLFKMITALNRQGRYDKINDNEIMKEYMAFINGIVIKKEQRLFAPFYLNKHIIDNVYINTIKNICGYLKIDTDFTKTNTILSLAQNNAVNKKIITSIIEYHATDKLSSIYRYGLEEQLDTLVIYDSIKWILEHKYYNTCPSVLDKLLHFLISRCDNKLSCNNIYKMGNSYVKDHGVDFDYVPQNLLNGAHRSGWAYVLNGVQKHFSNPNSDIIFDGYVDSTFFWMKEEMMALNKLPYRKSWIGIIHHTPNPEYTDYNVIALLHDPIFLKSLEHCKCLIVLSKYLESWLKDYLKHIGYSRIHVKHLYHPTEFVDNQFSIKNFIDNPNKKIVQIGGWLRNSYAIYDLQINNKLLNIHKACLRGQMMENYFKPNDFETRVELLENEFDEYQDDYYVHHVKKNSNKYIRGLIKSIYENDRSVQVIDKLNNNDYDVCLANNIVFLNLVNMSACNTLIECVVRCTPIIINRLPAAEEILGSKYPLFYDNMAEASSLVTNIDKIKAGYKYLKHLDKTELKLETFLTGLHNILVSIKN